jgi:DNA polymerase-1
MSENRPKLFLLDAYALIYRAYFAFINNPRVTSKGMDTSAIFGFVTTLLEVLEKQKPSHIAVVYDTAAPTSRHEEYPEYKAQREETPDGIRIAIPYISRLMDAFKIPFIGVDGFEADDVIGTLAKQAEKEGFEVFMMTPDKDFGQLVSEHIKMYRPGRAGNPAEIWGIEEIKLKFGIERVEQVIDYLGMMGDAVDNIPGFPGVGPKTAQKLLAEYGSMENMLEHAHEIKGKLGEKIRDNEALGRLSKKLATIITDAPIQFDAKLFEHEEADEKAIGEIFSELEFRTLLKRVTGEEIKAVAPAGSKPANGQQDLFAQAPLLPDNEDAPTPSAFKTLETTDHLYQLVTEPKERELLLKNLLKQSSVCFDTETTALDVLDADLLGIAFSYFPGRAYYVAVPEGKATEITEQFKPFFENASIEKVAQNLKYDYSILSKYGVEVQGKGFDTMLAHYLLQPDMRHNMDILAETYLHYKPVSIESLIGKKGKNQGNMRDVDLNEVTEYAGEDADITFQLKQLFEKQLEENNTDKVFHEIEVPLVPVLADMEMEGVNLDCDALQKLSEKLLNDITEIEASIKETAGVDFNLGSPKQLGEVLFDHMKLVDKPKKTKSGQYQTSEDILLELAKDHPIAEKIIDYRQMMKLKSTYVDALPGMVHKSTNRIHTSFNQAVAATGRLSSNNPNLQNIPIRTERGREVRKAFIPRDKDHLILAADYSQIELRLIAELSGDESMKDAFIKGEDIHAATASKVFNVPLEEVTREQRSNAKTVNFGIIYGVSSFGLSQQTSLSRSEAGEIIKSYFQTYPGIRDYIERQKELARAQGYVETIMGRRRYLKDINARNGVVRGHAERNAVNAPIQGSAADIIKIAMINIHKRLSESKLETKMILQVHDELVFDVPKHELEEVKPIIREAMEQAVKTEVPLVVDFGWGNNWLEAH